MVKFVAEESLSESCILKCQERVSEDLKYGAGTKIRRCTPRLVTKEMRKISERMQETP